MAFNFRSRRASLCWLRVAILRFVLLAVIQAVGAAGPAGSSSEVPRPPRQQEVFRHSLQVVKNEPQIPGVMSTAAGCSGPIDCTVGQYCDFRNVCYNCSYLSSKCDAIGLDCCSSEFLSRCLSDPFKCSHRDVLPACGGSPCAAALTTACGDVHSDVFKCAACAGTHQPTLRAAGCSNDNISRWCSMGSQRSNPPQSADANFFCGSRIITQQMRLVLKGWLESWPSINATTNASLQHWDPCFSSFGQNSTDPGLFHSGCDLYANTLVVFSNSLGVFGGFVRDRCVLEFLVDTDYFSRLDN
jgi:hypothetical protein